MGKCTRCQKYMFKSRTSCKTCLRKSRLKRKANSRGKDRATWIEYLRKAIR